jgi:hypothetical protein
LCQNGGFSVLSPVAEIEENRVLGDDSRVVFGEKKEVLGGALS